jgi:hypothetical protein
VRDTRRLEETAKVYANSTVSLLLFTATVTHEAIHLSAEPLLVA